MRLRLLKSKIHRATVTDTNLNYTGSVTVDADLLDAADMLPYEQVTIANITNGTRHETYIVIGERGSGDVCVMGAAAHLVNTGDKIILMAYCDMDLEEAKSHQAKIVLVDDNNNQIDK
jgi:aspartate 1-decarboxylase